MTRGPRDETRPLLRVVTPATAEEVAAIVAVLAATGGDEEPAALPRPEWSNPARGVRRPVRHGVGGWRASTLPQ